MCYSWWVLASLAMLGRLHWIDKQKMVCFILACQVSVAFSKLYGKLPQIFIYLILRIARLGDSRTGQEMWRTPSTLCLEWRASACWGR